MVHDATETHVWLSGPDEAEGQVDVHVTTQHQEDVLALCPGLKPC